MSKYILGCTIDTYRGTIFLPEKWLSKSSALLNILSSQWLLSVDNLRRLIGKLRYMHMTVPGARGRFYHLQLTLPRAVTKRHAYFSKGFYKYFFNWSQLWQDILNQQTFLMEVVHSLPNALGFCGTPGLVNGGVWIDHDGVSPYLCGAWHGQGTSWRT